MSQPEWVRFRLGVVGRDRSCFPVGAVTAVNGADISYIAGLVVVGWAAPPPDCGSTWSCQHSQRAAHTVCSLGFRLKSHFPRPADIRTGRKPLPRRCLLAAGPQWPRFVKCYIVYYPIGSQLSLRRYRILAEPPFTEPARSTLDDGRLAATDTRVQCIYTGPSMVRHMDAHSASWPVKACHSWLSLLP